MSECARAWTVQQCRENWLFCSATVQRTYVRRSIYLSFPVHILFIIYPVERAIAVSRQTIVFESVSPYSSVLRLPYLCDVVYLLSEVYIFLYHHNLDHSISILSKASVYFPLKKGNNLKAYILVITGDRCRRSCKCHYE